MRRLLRPDATRKWLREFASVVLGVLVALGLGAVATEIGWRLEVRSARSALGDELGELIGQADERVRLAPCIERRLDQLAAIVAAAEANGRLPPLGPIAMPDWRSWSRGVWSSTLSAQTAAHFDRDLLDNYSGAYEFADILADTSKQELTTWTQLYGLVGPGRPLDPGEARSLRAVISAARLEHRLMALSGLRLKQTVVAFDIGYDKRSADDYDRPLAIYAICKPIAATIPGTYGEAPFKGVIERAQARPITRNNPGFSKPR